MNKSKFLLLGNISFGIMAIAFWTLFVTIHIDIVFPIILNVFQFIFLFLQYLNGRTN
jgi:hypothetical protein